MKKKHIFRNKQCGMCGCRSKATLVIQWPNEYKRSLICQVDYTRLMNKFPISCLKVGKV